MKKYLLMKTHNKFSQMREEQGHTDPVNGTVRHRISIGSIASRYSLATLICALMLTLGVGNVWGADVSFTAGTDKNSTKTITKDGVTLTLSSGNPNLNAYDQYRIYSGQSFTIACTAGIKKIVVTTNTDKGNATKLSVSSGYSASGTTGTWAGDATSVTINADQGSQVRVTKIEVDKKGAAVTLTLKLPKGDGTFVDYETTDKLELDEHSTVVKEKLCYGEAAFYGGSWNSGYWTNEFIDYDDATATQPTRYNKSSTFSSNITLWPLYVYTDGATYYHTDPYCPTYHVYYDGNGYDGGTEPSDATDYDGGETATVAAKGTMTRTGYTFLGWSTSSSAIYADGDYDPGDSFTIEGDTYLYAVWCKNKPDVPTVQSVTPTGVGVTFTWKAIDDAVTYRVMVTDETKVVNITGTQNVSAPTTTYTFADGLEPGTNYYVGVQVVNNCGNTRTASQSFTTLDAYTITYNKNDDSGTTATEYKTEGVNYTISSDKFSRDNYTLSKWNTAPGGGGTDYAKGATYSTDAALDLYAVWTPAVYSVTKTFSGCTSASMPTSYTYTGTANDFSYTVTATAGNTLPSTISITMGGSSLTAGTDYTWNSSTGALAISTVITGNLVITISSQTLYTVTFSNAAGASPSAVTQVAEGGTVNIPSASACDGWTFAGWKIGSAQSSTTTDPTSTGTWITSESWPKTDYVPTSNVTAYAVFKKTTGGGAKVTLLSDDFSSITTGTNTSTTGQTSWDGGSNWTSLINASGANGMVKLGGKSSTGSMTASSALSVDNGTKITIRLKIKGWSSVEGNIVVSCDNSAFTNQTYSYEATMSDETEEVSSSVTLSAANPTITIATSAKRAFIDEVEIYSGGGGTTTWRSDVTCANLDHIAITTNPTKLNYLVGQPFDPTGAVVTAYYDNSTSADITSLVTWTPTGGLSSGTNQTITASYGGKTDSKNILNVYTLTIQKKNEEGTALSGALSDAPAVSVSSIVNLTAAETGAQHRFKEWQITNGTLSNTTELSTSITAVSGNVTVTAVYWSPIEVKWYVNGSQYGATGTYLRPWSTIYPSDPTPASVGCEGKVFIGWSRTPNYRSADTEPTDLVSSGEALTEDENFYAVFADKEGEGTPPTWAKTSFGSVTAGTYLICTSSGKVFNGEITSGHGQVTASAFTSANFSKTSFSEDAPIGSCEVTFSTNSSGWNMYNPSYGYLYCKGSSSGNLAWSADPKDYWFLDGGQWKYHGAKNGSGVYVGLSDYTTSFRTYTSPTAITLLKKTSDGSPAVYSDYTTSCTCSGFSFHTCSGTDEAVKASNTRTCFTQVGSSTTWQIEDYEIPSDAKFFVGYQDEFKSSGLGTSSRSSVQTWAAEMYFEYSKNYGDGWRKTVGAATGAVGTLRIWSDNSWNNCHIGFDPNGYVFKLGSTNLEMHNATSGLDGAQYKETDVITLTSTDISGNFQVNLYTGSAGGVACDNSVSKAMTTMGVKSGSGDSWRGTSVNAGADANTKGFFRIDLASTHTDTKNWNAHWVPVWELTFDLKGGSGTIATTPEYVTAESASKVVQIPTTAPTKTGYRFMGWSDDDDSSVEYAAGSTHNVTLSGNKTVYAVWAQEYPVTYAYAGGSGSCAGGTYIAGETVTVCASTPTKAGSTFNGWSYSPSVTVTTGTFPMPTSDVTITATWIDTEYDLTHYGSNYTNTEGKTKIKSGDTSPSGLDLHYTCTGDYAFPNSITISGGRASWTLSTDYTWTVAGDKQSATLHIAETTITSNVSITISMQTRCTITYTIPSGGGSCATTPTTAVLSGETVTLPNVTGISSSYSCETFIGWTTSVPNGGGTWDSSPTIKAAGATSATIDANTTFYAVYSRSGAGASGTVDLTQDNITAWYSAANSAGTTAYTSENSYTTGGYTWNAKCQQSLNNSLGRLNLRLRTNSNGVSWIQIPTMPGNIRTIECSVSKGSNNTTGLSGYNITFQTGKTSSESVIATSNSNDVPTRTIDLSEVSYTTGYLTSTYDGTINIHSITVTYGPPPVISHTLLCGCEVPQFDLTYDANTANFPGSSTSCVGEDDYVFADNGNEYTICATEPTCAGYKFTGWTTNANGSGNHYDAGDEITCVPTATVTLYAQYEQVYTVTFNNQGTLTPVTQGSYGAAVDVPSATTPCDESWAFIGWSTTEIAPKSLLPDIEIAAGTSTYTPTEDVTLYAIYRKTITSDAFTAGLSGAYKIKATYNSTDYYAQACNNNKLPHTSTASNGTVFYISYTAADGGKYAIQQVNGKYVAYAGSSTSIELRDDPAYWTISASGGKWSVQVNGGTRYLRYSDGTGFKAYDSNVDANVLDFVAAEGQYYYRTMSCASDFNITFHDNGTTITWAPGHAEGTYKHLANGTVVSTFPTASFGGWTFLGWRTATYAESTTAPASSGIYGGSDGTSGNTLTIASADVDLYPVFTRFEDNEQIDLINGGDYYIYFKENGSDDGYGANKRVYATTYADHCRYSSTATCDAATMFTFTKLPNGNWTIYDNSTHKYLYGIDGDDIKQQDGTSGAEWTLTVNGNQFDAYHVGTSYGQLIAQGDGTSATFMNYRRTNIANNPSLYHRVYLGTCTNRTFTTDPVIVPKIEIKGEVKVTSTAGKGIRSASVLTVSAKNIPTSQLRVSTNPANSAVKFCLTPGGTYTATVDISVPGTGTVAPTPVYVEYTPTITTDGIEDVTVKVSDLGGTPTEKESDAGAVQCRHLPADFVIAAKLGDNWYALPANCTSSSSSTAGVLIDVDNVSDPTSATAPSYTKYGLQTVRPGRKAEHGTKLVFVEHVSTATEADQKTLFKGLSTSNKTGIQLYSSYLTYANTNPRAYEWVPTTTDLKDYILTSDTTVSGDSQNRTLSLNTSAVFQGLLTGKAYDGKVRLLPATFFEPAEAQILKWKANSVIVMYTGTEASATTTVGTNSASSAQTLSSQKLTHGIYELTTDQALTSNSGKLLSIAFGSTRLEEEIPLIIASNTTASANGKNVVILDGAKFTAAYTKRSYDTVYVYGGGKLDVPTGTKIGVKKLILRAGSISTNGSGGSATYEYKYPQVKLVGTDVTSTKNHIQYEFVTDYSHWYHLCLPFNGTLSTICYPQEYYGSSVTAGNKGSWVIKRYDGATRATGDYEHQWKDIESEDATTVTAGHGYIFWGAPKKVSVGGAAKERQAWGIQRILMPITSGSAVVTAESGNKTVSGLSSYSDVEGKTQYVSDHGWNLIGNPYMANLTAIADATLKTGKWVADGGGWKINEGDDVRYVTIPDDNFGSYTAQPVSWFTAENPMIAGRAFFVQLTGADDAVTFHTANRASLAPAWQRTATTDVETGIVLSSETLTDEVNFWIKDGKTAEYEYNADYPKMMNQTNMNIYGVHEAGNLSWVAVSPEIAEEAMAIGYQVPEAGEYVLSLSEKVVSDEVEAIYVTDHAMLPEVTTNLVEQSYLFTVHQAETNNERFTVSIKVREKEADISTGVDEQSSDRVADKPVKFIWNDKMYILQRGIIFDATGKRVNVINK